MHVECALCISEGRKRGMQTVTRASVLQQVLTESESECHLSNPNACYARIDVLTLGSLVQSSE